jgi:hypothetical protein
MDTPTFFGNATITAEELNEKARAAREQLLAGTVSDTEWCMMMGRCKRTLDRQIARGKPFTKFGSERRHDIAADREWFLSQSQSRAPKPPRGRGRSRKEGRR